jgi:hypothetical protein
METRTQLGSCHLLLLVDKSLHDCARFRGLSLLQYAKTFSGYSKGINLSAYGNKLGVVEFDCDGEYANNIISEYEMDDLTANGFCFEELLEKFELTKADTNLVKAKFKEICPVQSAVI